jgi:predicted membrane protein (TIGR00267 family)
MVDKELKGGILDRKITKKMTMAASVDGIATILGGAIPILPYLFMSSDRAIFVSVGLVIGVIFIIGMYLGKLSKKNILFSALKMSFFAAAVAGVVYLIQSAIVPTK